MSTLRPATVRVFTLVALCAGAIATPLLVVAPAATAVSGRLLVRTDFDCTLIVNGKPLDMLKSRGEGTAVDLSEGHSTIACTTEDGTRLAVITFAPIGRYHVVDGTPMADPRVEQLDLDMRRVAERWRGVVPQSGHCGLAPPSAADGLVGMVYDDSAAPLQAIISCVNYGFGKSTFALMRGSRFHLAGPVHILRRCPHCPDLIAVDIEADSPVDPNPGAVFIDAPPPCVLTDRTRGYVAVAHVRCRTPK